MALHMGNHQAGVLPYFLVNSLVSRYFVSSLLGDSLEDSGFVLLAVECLLFGLMSRRYTVNW